MKSRRIIHRNACFTPEMFKAGILYRLVKVNNRFLTEDDYWYNALCWLRGANEYMEDIGMLKAGVITGVYNDTLFPCIAFDRTYQFQQIDEKGVVVKANLCRFKSVTYLKTF
jgi:hypothetical protein